MTASRLALERSPNVPVPVGYLVPISCLVASNALGVLPGPVTDRTAREHSQHHRSWRSVNCVGKGEKKRSGIREKYSARAKCVNCGNAPEQFELDHNMRSPHAFLSERRSFRCTMACLYRLQKPSAATDQPQNMPKDIHDHRLPNRHPRGEFGFQSSSNTRPGYRRTSRPCHNCP